MSDKGVTVSVTFKALTLEEGDEAVFNATLDEALAATKSQILGARLQYTGYKDAAVDGIPTLEEKGVSVSVSVSF